MDHASLRPGLVTQPGSGGRQHAPVSEDDSRLAQASTQVSLNIHSASSPAHISSSQSSSSSTTHLRAFDPSDPTTLSIKPMTSTAAPTSASISRATPDATGAASVLGVGATNTSTATDPASLTAIESNHERRGSALTIQEPHHTHVHDHDHDQQAADTEKDCDHRRPEEEDGSRRPKMSSQLMSKTVAPFLKDHIPGLYSPMTKRGTIKDMEGQNKDPNSRYCYRHRPDSKCRRAADESKMVKIQQELENLKPDDQQAITHVWSLFSAAPAKQRDLMLQGIMTQCCFPQLSKVSREKISNPTPSPTSPFVLCYLDPVSLCKAAVVSKEWRALADDDHVWHHMCEQHIDRKCTKCGFGLPLLERKRLRGWTRNQQLTNGQQTDADKPRIPTHAPTLPAPSSLREAPSPLKRDASDFFTDDLVLAKRPCTDTVASSSTSESAGGSGGGSNAGAAGSSSSSNSSVGATERDLELARALEQDRKPRAWKDVYRDRFRVGYNWRNGRCAVKVFRGHTNGVTCLQIDDVMMATGSYDATIRIWNLETGEQTRVLRGHMQGIRSLQFDDKILVSGSLDGTMKIWNWHTGELLNTLVCHQGGVISVHLDGAWLASGSTDKTIKVFNLKTKESFTLKGHSDWVNQVRIDGTASRTLFSASDDCTVKLWDLESKRCIRTFEGHVGHVQQVLTLPADFEPDEDPVASGHKDKADTSSVNSGRGGSPVGSGEVLGDDEYATRAAYGPGFLSNPNRPLPNRYILSSALDSTIKCWDTATGKCVRTFFGHLEGVWALVGDTLRVVSGANDTMVKVWEPRSGKCERTWTGHRGPVTCVGLSDSRLASGSEDGEVRLYSFQDRAGLEEYGTPS
ncbi:F-box and WD-40 domain protein MET30 [Sporothrix schenckii 1099-18]|uniref:F-box and WD-40 domain protein MET30 n=1 Tax=Sporothrix schenckii 1099-18 TaxID=1397361 RepID=A0A0F2MGE6_SPOSC|nr:F-box and WD-40 domain protein MET30 [Sporothrix schenckii 1099-18]KJR88134.1 F-box and WD-40 domain protein MET30 [Sporothrix schenckii 1099-18]